MSVSLVYSVMRSVHVIHMFLLLIVSMLACLSNPGPLDIPRSFMHAQEKRRVYGQKN